MAMNTARPLRSAIFDQPSIQPGELLIEATAAACGAAREVRGGVSIHYQNSNFGRMMKKYFLSLVAALVALCPLNPALAGSGISGTANPIFVQAGTSAASRTFLEKARDVVSVKDFGAKGDGVADDTAAIQKAIDNGKPVYFPAGTYLLSLGTNITLEGGATKCALKAKTGMQLIGSGWGSVLKLKDNQSTNGSPVYFNIIASNEVLDGVRIENLKFDINGANNKINANNGYNAAAFIVSGSVATVGVDARLSNAKVLNNYFTHTPGNSVLGIGQSNSVGTVLGKNIEIAGNTFADNGLDTNDHSSVYAWANSVNIHNNIFTASAMSNGTNGPRVAAELHGSRNSFHNNKVFNYFQGLWLAGNLTSVSVGQSVTNNNFTVAHMGMGVFMEVATEPGLSDLTISGNRIVITDDSHAATKVGIGITPSRGHVDRVVVSGNVLKSFDDNIAVALKVGSIATSGVSQVDIRRNRVEGFTQGVWIGLAAGQKVTGVNVTGNALKVTTTTGTPTYAFGVYLPGVVGVAEIANNRISGTYHSAIYTDSTFTASELRINNNSGSGTFTAGINLTTNRNVTNLGMDGNDFVLAGSSIIIDKFTVTGRRTGKQAR